MSRKEQSRKHEDFSITDEQMADAWEAAIQSLRESGQDPEDIIKKAALNLSAWRDNPYHQEIPMQFFLDESEAFP